jgi:hypothetical protein
LRKYRMIQRHIFWNKSNQCNKKRWTKDQNKHLINLKIQEDREMIIRGKPIKGQLLSHNKCLRKKQFLQGSSEHSQSPQLMQQMNSHMYREYRDPYAYHSSMQSPYVGEFIKPWQLQGMQQVDARWTKVCTILDNLYNLQIQLYFLSPSSPSQSDQAVDAHTARAPAPPDPVRAGGPDL